MSYEAPIELLSPAREPREECFLFPPLQSNYERLEKSLPHFEKAIQHSRGFYETLKMEFEDLKKTCTILVANLNASEKKLEAVTVDNLVLKSDTRLDELQRENKQLQDERTGHQMSQRNCLNEIQSMKKERSDLYKTLLKQVKKTSKLHVDALQFTLKKEREQALKQKQAFHDEVASLQHALNIAKHCIRMTQGSAIGELGDGEMLSSVDRPKGSDVTSESSDVTSRIRADIENLKDHLMSSVESSAASKRSLAQENVALQEKLKVLPPPAQAELKWMVNFKRLQRFKARRDYNWATIDIDLGFWVIHQRRQLREYTGNKRRRIDLLNSIDFNWGAENPLNKKNHGTNL